MLDSFFHAAAARTAGFSTWTVAQSDERSLFFLLGLMVVGGAPGSMAGGIKITTAGTLLAGVWSTLRNRSEPAIGDRRLASAQLAQALAVAFLGVAVISVVTLAISEVEGAAFRAPFLHLAFEVTSAFGTVGFSTGVTPQLSVVSKLLLAFTMFVGRLGPVTFVSALMERPQRTSYRWPVEAVRIG
jgi:trk system potassium uptake protein TrkH